MSCAICNSCEVKDQCGGVGDCTFNGQCADCDIPFPCENVVEGVSDEAQP